MFLLFPNSKVKGSGRTGSDLFAPPQMLNGICNCRAGSDSIHVIPQRVDDVFFFDLADGIHHGNKDDKKHAEHAYSDILLSPTFLWCVEICLQKGGTS